LVACAAANGAAFEMSGMGIKMNGGEKMQMEHGGQATKSF